MRPNISRRSTSYLPVVILNNPVSSLDEECCSSQHWTNIINNLTKPSFYFKTKSAFADIFLVNLTKTKGKEMRTLSQDRSKRHSGGYGEDRSDLYGAYDSYGSYGYSSGGGGGGGYSCGGCCHQKQDNLLLPLILAGIAAAAGYLFGQNNNNNNGRNFGLQPGLSARTAQVILEGEFSLKIGHIGRFAFFLIY